MIRSSTPIYPPRIDLLFRDWSWVMPFRSAGDYLLCSDGWLRHRRFPERAFRHG